VRVRVQKRDDPSSLAVMLPVPPKKARESSPADLPHFAFTGTPVWVGAVKFETRISKSETNSNIKEENSKETHGAGLEI
jgi:hypothetical protein